MRGSPPIQALFLILTLLVLGFLGNRYIQAGHSHIQEPNTKPIPIIPTDHIEVEIKLTFSSPPLRYSLKTPPHPSEANSPNDHLLFKDLNTIKNPISNPSYHDTTLPAHRINDYWLDVVWASDPNPGSKHMVQLKISPSYGVEKSYSFSSDTQELKATFDYTTEGGTAR